MDWCTDGVEADPEGKAFDLSVDSWSLALGSDQNEIKDTSDCSLHRLPGLSRIKKSDIQRVGLLLFQLRGSYLGGPFDWRFSRQIQLVGDPRVDLQLGLGDMGRNHIMI